jgi:tryptophanyl-tRNA synthetase
MSSPTFPDRVFSGVQPTGTLTLGNYLGAIRRFADYQDRYQCLYCVVDMHAITLWQDPSELHANTLGVTAAYLAAGLDPEKNIIFNQSQVPQHAEMAWVFNCVTRIGWLNRMTQFKEKAGKHRENASAGLYVYPSLMAADILVYKATHVPVGDDQKQHLELARDIAQKFNHDYGDIIRKQTNSDEFFPQPEPLIEGPAMRVMSLRDATKKMSKSDPSDMSRINMDDDADMIAQKIRKAKTDPEPLPSEDAGFEGRPEAENLLGIYAALAQEPKLAVVDRFAGAQFSEFKKDLTELAVSTLAPVSDELRRLKADPGYLETVLRSGAEKAAELAEPVMRDTKAIVGFVGADR